MKSPLSLLRGLILPVLLTVLVLFTAPSPAYAEFVIGGEFEFVDPTVAIVPKKGLKGHEQDMAWRFEKALSANCKALGCEGALLVGKHGIEMRFTLPDGFWIQISIDPNVVEILTKPVSLEYYQKNARLIQKLIWGSAQDAGLAVDPTRRAGHFNFSTQKAFDGKSKDFLKFFIDFANRPELSTGIFRQENLLNAPHLAHLESSQRKALSKLIEDYREPPTRMQRLKTLWLKEPLAKMNIPQIAEKILKTVLNKSSNSDHAGEYAWHYQALGLKRLVKLAEGEDAPTELRAVRSQRDVYDFILLAELIEKRIEYVKSLPEDVAFRVSETSRTQFNSHELVDRFYLYVSEAGLPWERYQRLLHSEIALMEPLNFLREARRAPMGPTDLPRLTSLMDLLPTSPWLQKITTEILLNPNVPEFEKNMLLREIRSQSENSTLSPEAKTAMKIIAEELNQNFIKGPKSCSSIF